MTTDLEENPEALAELPTMRCADSARMRGEPLHASAVRYRRFLLLEVPGPWGSSALDDKRMGASIAQRLSEKAKTTDTHVLLIRRPGRHPSDEASRQRAMAWAFADTSSERVLWGAWREPADLLDLDLSADIPGEANAAGPQRLALVCTNGKRDQCCALRGRPVAKVIAADTDWDTWECSHLGGHRFAATMMLLPTGDMFGWLNGDSALEVLRRFDSGQLVLSHYRGQAGQPSPVQAALHAAAVRMGDFRRGAFRVISADSEAEARWAVTLVHRSGHNTETAYRVVLTESTLAPTFLSCSDSCPRAETRLETLSFSAAELAADADSPDAQWPVTQTPVRATGH